MRDGSATEVLLNITCVNVTSGTMIVGMNRWMWVKFYANYENQYTGFTGSLSVITARKICNII